MLFSIGGNIECLTFKNIRHHNPSDNRTLFEIGLPFYDTNFVFPENNKPKLKNIIIDGLTIIENSPASADADYIKIFSRLDRLVVSDVLVVREYSENPSGHLISLTERGSLGLLVMRDVVANGFHKLIEGEERIEKTISKGVLFER